MNAWNDFSIFFFVKKSSLNKSNEDIYIHRIDRYTSKNKKHIERYNTIPYYHQHHEYI